MSARSNGVMNVVRKPRSTSRAMPSASCSRSRISWKRGLSWSPPATISRKATAALTITAACRSKAGKKASWRGINR